MPKIPFHIKKYGNEVKFSPLFIETAASVITSMFILFWGLLFFANDLFQLSLFTKIRNGLLSEEIVTERELKNIYGIGVDPEAVLYYENTYDRIASAIESLTDYALAHEEIERIIVGLDFLFFAENETDNVENLIKAIARIPDNLFLVFGMTLEKFPNSVESVGPEFVYPAIIENERTKTARSEYLQTLDAESRKRYQFDLADHFFFGHVHLSQGGIRSGFTQALEKSHVGLVPLLPASGGKFYPSLSFMMYLLGEIPDYPTTSDLAGGQLNDLSTSAEREKFGNILRENSGRDFSEYYQLQYINFRTDKNIDRLNLPMKRDPLLNVDIAPTHYVWLSRISSEMTGREPSAPHPFDINPPIYVGLNENNSTKYFFVFSTPLPAYFNNSGIDDEIYTPAAKTDSFTLEKNPVFGVMAHIQALSNLIHNKHLDRRNDLTTLFSIIIIFATAILIWRSSLLQSLLYTALMLMFAFFISFSFFTFAGYFLSVKPTLISVVLVFAVISAVRFIFTSKNFDKYELAVQSVFSSSTLKKIKEHEHTRGSRSWRTLTHYDSGLFIIVKPKNLADLERKKSDGEQLIGEQYINMLFKNIEACDGGHMLFGNFVIVGFWNIPMEGDKIETLLQVESCIHSILATLSIIKQKQLSALQTDTTASDTFQYDLVLHRGECFAGVNSSSIDAVRYEVIGNSVNEALGMLFRQSQLHQASILLSDVFASHYRETTGEVSAFLESIRNLPGDIGKDYIIVDEDGNSN